MTAIAATPLPAFVDAVCGLVDDQARRRLTDAVCGVWASYLPPRSLRVRFRALTVTLDVEARGELADALAAADDTADALAWCFGQLADPVARRHAMASAAAAAVTLHQHQTGLSTRALSLLVAELPVTAAGPLKQAAAAVYAEAFAGAAN